MLSALLFPDSPSPSVAVFQPAVAPARWFFRLPSQLGDVKRCTTVTEQRSRSFGEIVGSCVAMTIRAPRCLWRRIVDKSESVRVWLSALSVMNLWASSRAITRPMSSEGCSRNKFRQMLNSEHADSAVTQGQDKSTMVNCPA